MVNVVAFFGLLVLRGAPHNLSVSSGPNNSFFVDFSYLYPLMLAGIGNQVLFMYNNAPYETHISGVGIFELLVHVAKEYV